MWIDTHLKKYWSKAFITNILDFCGAWSITKGKNEQFVFWGFMGKRGGGYTVSKGDIQMC